MIDPSASAPLPSLLGQAKPNGAASDTLQSLVRTARAGGPLDTQSMRAAAKEYESMFLASVFETLHQGIKTDGPFGGGQGEAMFRSLLTQEHAKAMAAQGGIGLADRIVSELQRLQEV